MYIAYENIMWNRKYSTAFLSAQISIWSGRILGLRPANERRRDKVTPSLTG